MEVAWRCFGFQRFVGEGWVGERDCAAVTATWGDSERWPASRMIFNRMPPANMTSSRDRSSPSPISCPSRWDLQDRSSSERP